MTNKYKYELFLIKFFHLILFYQYLLWYLIIDVYFFF